MTDDAADRPAMTFSTACSSIERILLVVALLAAPAIAGRMLFSLTRSANNLGISIGELIRTYGGAPLVAVTLLGAVFLMVYSPMYLQYRARGRVRVDDEGFHFERTAFLPGGLLARDVRFTWDEMLGAQFRNRRVGLSRRPELNLTWKGGSLTLRLAQLWQVGPDRKAPLIARAPESVAGWRDHPLVTLALEKDTARRIASAKATKPDEEPI